MAIDDRAAAASRAGRTLVPDEGVQVAGKGNVIFEILKALGAQPSRVRTTPRDELVAPNQGRIPTASEERLLEPGEYQARQQQQAPQMLSQEGLQRFEEAGYSATDAITPPPTAQAIDALDADPMAETVAEAQQNLRTVDTETMIPRPGKTDAGAADEVDALGAAKAVEEEKVSNFVNAGADGLDFNFGNLETGDDVKAMINEVSEIYADPTTAAKRGVVTQQETLAEAEQMLADEMGFTRQLLKRKRGVPFNAAEATASRIVMVRSIERLTDMAQQIKNGERSSAFLVAFRRQMSIHAGIQMQVKGMQTEIARAMNAFNIPVGARNPEAIADMADLMLRETGGAREAVKLAKGFLDVQNREGKGAAHKFVFGTYLSKANGVFSEFYVNGLLSWTYTHLKNALATPAFMMYQTAEEVIAGLYGGVERGIGRALGVKPEGLTRAGFGNTADGVYSGQALARLFGWSRASKEAWITAAETWRTEVAADSLTKIETAQLRAIDAENLNISGKAGQFIDKLGRAIRIPGRALMAADDFWRVYAQRGELNAEAYHQAMTAKSLGKSDQEALDNFAMSLLDPRSYANQLDAAARYNALTTDTGFLGELTAGFQNIPVIGRLMLPFSKVPINSVLRVMERFAPTTGIFKDPVKRQKAMARVTLAWGAVYTLSEYAYDGRITGSMPADQRQRDMLPPGWRPYSVVFRGDNWPTDADGDDLPIFDPRTGAPNGPLTYVSYAGLEPVGAILGIVASTAERMRRSNDPQLSISHASAAIAASADYFTDMPMIKVIGDLVKAFDKHDLTGVMSGPLRGFMPYSAAVRAVERAVDPTVRKPSGQPEYYTLADVQNKDVVPYRDLGSGQSEPRLELVGQIKGGMGAWVRDSLQKYESMLTDRVLFGGADDDTSAVKYDVFGEVREANVRFDVNPVLAMHNMIIPFNVRHGKQMTDAQFEQIRLKGPLRDTKRKEQGFGFSEAFRSHWTRAAKREVYIVNDNTKEPERFNDALNALIASLEYGGMTDKEQFDAIRDLEDEYFDAGLEMTLSMPQYADVRVAYENYLDVKAMFKDEGRLRR